MIVVPEGFEVWTADGKLVAVAARDIYSGELVRADQFINYAGAPFERHKRVPPEIFRLISFIERNGQEWRKLWKTAAA